MSYRSTIWGGEKDVMFLNRLIEYLFSLLRIVSWDIQIADVILSSVVSKDWEAGHGISSHLIYFSTYHNCDIVSGCWILCVRKITAILIGLREGEKWDRTPCHLSRRRDKTLFTGILLLKSATWPYILRLVVTLSNTFAFSLDSVKEHFFNLNKQSLSLSPVN